MLSLHTNINDLILQRTLYEGTLGLNDAINRMTTGLKVNHAKDNAAGYSIIENLNTRISSMLQVQANTEDGISLLSTAQGGLEEIQGLLVKLRELTVQASTGTYDSKSRASMQSEKLNAAPRS
jgi:flagellin